VTHLLHSWISADQIISRDKRILFIHKKELTHVGLNVKRERTAQADTTSAKIYHGHKKVTLHHVKMGERAGVQQILSTSCGHNSLGRASFIEKTVSKKLPLHPYIPCSKLDSSRHPTWGKQLAGKVGRRRVSKSK
jgi:hypothetical protein